ncbi:MAG TPA: ribonuclease HI [Aggregatilineales bacterium]|jgi:ribonuclease HI|nr:ribonuclease HI [Aggregatilineales bacterium]
MIEVTIYSDGGAQPNPGPGGWAALILYPDREQVVSGGSPATTNNQMELTAACAGLEALDEACEITFYTDSTYVRSGITSWLAGWKRSNWLNSKREPVANKELWQRLDQATRRHKIHWKWVKGHAGNVYNERVDRLATAARKRITGETVTDDAPLAAPDAPTGPAAYLVARGDNRSDHRAVWAALIVDHEGERLIGGRLGRSESENHAALLGAIALLEALPDVPALTVFTEVDYLQKGINLWVKGWMKKGWKTASGDPVKYRDRWERLQALTAGREARFTLKPGNIPEMKQAAAHAVGFYWK